MHASMDIGYTIIRHSPKQRSSPQPRTFRVERLVSLSCALEDDSHDGPNHKKKLDVLTSDLSKLLGEFNHYDY